MRWLLLFFTLTANAASIPDLVEKIAPSVVFVTHPANSGSGLSIGDGYILAAGHVVTPPVMGVVDDEDNAHPAIVVGADADADVGLLRLREGAHPTYQSSRG